MCLAVPGKLISIGDGTGVFRSGKIDFGGVVRDVNLAFLPDAEVGEYLLVHVGIALSRIDEAEADRVFEALSEIGALDEVRE